MDFWLLSGLAFALALVITVFLNSLVSKCYLTEFGDFTHFGVWGMIGASVLLLVGWALGLMPINEIWLSSRDWRQCLLPFAGLALGGLIGSVVSFFSWRKPLIAEQSSGSSQYAYTSPELAAREFRRGGGSEIMLEAGDLDGFDDNP